MQRKDPLRDYYLLGEIKKIIVLCRFDKLLNSKERNASLAQLAGEIILTNSSLPSVIYDKEIIC